jgi:hypothetical protein
MKPFLLDLSELFPTVIRVLFVTFERDKYSPNSPGGRRHLATMLLKIPDDKAVEDAHGRLRNLQRKAKHTYDLREFYHKTLRY